MYEENSSNISIKGIIVKILLIVLAICVLIWIFPTKKDLQNSIGGVSFNNEGNTNLNIDPLLNTIFGQNIHIMQNAGRAYYYSATLPKNNGDTSTVTLQELINKKMLVEFKDKNGNTCNTTASYVELTKTGTNKYQMKTYLQCNGEENYIIANLGCTDLCPNSCTNTTTTKNNTSTSSKTDKETGSAGVTDKKTYRYLYSCPKTTTSWSNWSDWSTNYVSKTSNREVETKTTSSYGKTGTTTKYRETTVNKKYYSNTRPVGVTCVSAQKVSATGGFYMEYTCTETIREPYQVDTYGYTTTTLYRYRTKTSKTTTTTEWNNSNNNKTLLNKGCTIIKTELVTTK